MTKQLFPDFAFFCAQTTFTFTFIFIKSIFSLTRDPWGPPNFRTALWGFLMVLPFLNSSSLPFLILDNLPTWLWMTGMQSLRLLLPRRVFASRQAPLGELPAYRGPGARSVRGKQWLGLFLQFPNAVSDPIQGRIAARPRPCVKG